MLFIIIEYWKVYLLNIRYGKIRGGNVEMFSKMYKLDFVGG